MFDFSSLLKSTRTEIISGKLVSLNTAELYTGNTVRINGLVKQNDIGKSVKLLKEGLEYTIINFTNKNNRRTKVFIV